MGHPTSEFFHPPRQEAVSEQGRRIEEKLEEAINQDSEAELQAKLRAVATGHAIVGAL
jgi:hypothetical protein